MQARRDRERSKLMTASDVINRRDLDFLLYEWLDLGELLSRPRFCAHDREEIDAMLSQVQRLALQALAPHLRASDLSEPFLDAAGNVRVLPEVRRAVRLLAEAGLFGSVFEENLGGLQLPYLVYIAAMGLLMSGSIATASFMLLTVANARLIASQGSASQISTFARPQIAGEALGTMCLSEPHAGSSLGDIRTRAESDGEDEHGRRFRVFGNKMWISAADHDVTEQIVHLVLAKLSDSSGRLVAGTRGISLLVVPKVLPDGAVNDLRVTGLNHKMGYRGIPNCALNFGDGRVAPGGRPGAIGWLIGEKGQGLRHMFQMMNEARIAVGLGGAMLAYRGYLMALSYAQTRIQGRPPGRKDGAPVPIICHADVKRMLLAQKAYAEGALALVLFSARLLDEKMTAESQQDRDEAGALLALLTPVAKTWAAEWGQRGLDYAIQIHGGGGYSRDFEVEQLYRDNRLNSIHEGTTGIHAIDLVSRKLRHPDVRGMAILRKRVTATIQASRRSIRLINEAKALDAAWTAIERAVDHLRRESDEARALAHATPFLFAFGHGVAGWLWLDQARMCERVPARGLEGAELNYREGKLRACRYFSEFELPKIAGWLAPILADTDVTTSMRAEQFLGALE